MLIKSALMVASRTEAEVVKSNLWKAILSVKLIELEPWLSIAHVLPWQR